MGGCLHLYNFHKYLVHATSHVNEIGVCLAKLGHTK